MDKLFSCSIEEGKQFFKGPCLYERISNLRKDPNCLRCSYYLQKIISKHPTIESPYVQPAEVEIFKLKMLLIDFCNVKKWELKTLSDLIEKHRIQMDYDEDVATRCKTRHDPQHSYCLIENEDSKILQKHIPESYIIPSQPEFRKLWQHLKKSQTEYKGFLDSCIEKPDFYFRYLNTLIANLQSPEPMFFRAFPRNPKNREKKSVKWNPRLSLMGHGEFIEDAIELEIINTFLSHQGDIFSTLGHCKNCNAYFIAKRETREYCGDQCRFDWNNRIKKEKQK